MSDVSILDRAQREGLLAEGRPVVVLYSGGADSTCLLDLAARIAGRGAVSALHINYGLRDAADTDEEHCARTCSGVGVPLEVRRPKRPETGNLQGWARDARYGAAAQIAQARGADVAAGHTASDQVETILYRLASSPSRRALLGMRAREGLLVRPLLRFTHAETEAYCRERGLQWREDASNASRAYARNRIRAELVPALEAVHPAALQNLLALIEILRDEGEALDSVVDDVLRGADFIDIRVLRGLPAGLGRLVVQRMADTAAGRLAPGVARRAPEIAALPTEGSAALHVGAGLRAVVEYGRLRFEVLAPAPSAPAAVTLPVPGGVVFGECEVRCELGPPELRAGVVDRDALAGELLVRPWRRGDRMWPLGLGGEKSLQDLFTARRVPRSQRRRLPVVESGGEIVWVAGVATSERFKVTDASVRAAHLSVRELAS